MQSSKRLIENKIAALGLDPRFKVFSDKIEAPGDGLVIFRRMQDHYEAVGQVLAFHDNWLRSNGYPQAILYLPHDGIAANNVTGKRYEDHLREAVFTIEPAVQNQGKGAAMMRIEPLRRLGPQLWFNESTTEPDRGALGFYHERKDETRGLASGRSTIGQAMPLMHWADGDLLRAAGQDGGLQPAKPVCGAGAGVRADCSASPRTSELFVFSLFDDWRGRFRSGANGGRFRFR